MAPTGKRLLPLFSILIAASAHAFTLYSPFESQVEGISIRNARYVGNLTTDEEKANAVIFRSMRPFIRNPSFDPRAPNFRAPMMIHEPYIDELKTKGITDILIFKDPEPARETSADQRTDIQIENDALASAGFLRPYPYTFNLRGEVIERDVNGEVPVDDYTKRGVRDLPFPWKSFASRNISFKDVCVMTVKALKLIRQVKLEAEAEPLIGLDGAPLPRRKLLFHCTVGEDRTGSLAFFASALDEQSTFRRNPMRIKEIFVDQACRGGYSSGNAGKPTAEHNNVVGAIETELTPFVAKMSYKILRGFLRWDHLNFRTCDFDLENDDEYDATVAEEPELYAPSSYRCEKSTDFPTTIPKDPHVVVWPEIFDAD